MEDKSHEEKNQEEANLTGQKEEEKEPWKQQEMKMIEALKKKLEHVASIGQDAGPFPGYWTQVQAPYKIDLKDFVPFETGEAPEGASLLDELPKI